MSWKLEIKVEHDDNWWANGIRFATKKEAMDYGIDLTARWGMILGIRAIQSADAVRHRFTHGFLQEV